MQTQERSCPGYPIPRHLLSGATLTRLFPPTFLLTPHVVASVEINRTVPALARQGSALGTGMAARDQARRISHSRPSRKCGRSAYYTRRKRFLGALSLYCYSSE